MLYFNVKRVLDLRGIDKQYAFLVKNGFVHATAINYTSGRVVQIKIEQIEKLCLLLNCEPSDLFEWRQSEKSPLLAEYQALNNLKREQNAPTITEIVKDLPVEKMEEIGELLKQLKDKE